MAFGGYAPLPLRLGGSTTEGWTAEQHARMCADVEAARRTATIARITVTLTDADGGSATVNDYIGINGVGTSFAPTVTVDVSGTAEVVWPNSYVDAFEESRNIHITSARASAQDDNLWTTVTINSPNKVTIRFYDSSGTQSFGKFTLKVNGPFGESPRIAQYGGDVDKINSPTEGDTPYAWTWYQEFDGMLPSAFTSATSGPVHSLKVAAARQNAALTRAQERTIANSLPGTSDEMLGTWATVLAVPTGSEQNDSSIRRAAAAKFKASRGPTVANVDEALTALLGDIFVETNRSAGSSLSSPPTITYWPGVNPGPSGYDLGGGTWASERAHVGVVVAKPPDLSDFEFNSLMYVQLYQLLDPLLPAWVTFDWATSDGFLLDISQLDFDGL